MKQPRVRPRSPRQRGSVLVEFAFICLAFYLLFAGTLELGKMITVSQAIQNAARVGARELALVARRPTARFDEPFNPASPYYNLPDCQYVRTRIYDPSLLVVDASGGTPDTSNWPVVNRMLFPLMIRASVGGQPVLHYPGCVIALPGGGRTVAVPHVVDFSGSVATIRWLPVLEEVRSNPADLNSGPYSLASSGPERGLVALRINYPYQATTMTAFHVAPGGGPTMDPVLVGTVQAQNASGGTPLAHDPTTYQDPGGGGQVVLPGDAYGGEAGLGIWFAMGASAPNGVRPFSRLITTQSFFRREVFAQ